MDFLIFNAFNYQKVLCVHNFLEISYQVFIYLVKLGIYIN